MNKVIVPNLKFDPNEFELEGEIVDNVKQKCLDGSIFEYYLVKTKYGINKYIKEEVKPKQKSCKIKILTKMRKEDYNVIAPDNKVWNFQKWIENPNYDIVNDISENPYPVMYVEGEPVWEGDKLIFNGMDYGSMNDDNYPEGKPYQTLREVKWNHRGIIRSNKVWVNHWSWSIKPKVM